MLYIANLLFLLIVLGCSIPILFLCAECFSAAFVEKQQTVIERSKAEHDQQLDIALIIPAHNEASGIRAMLDNLMPQLGDEHQVIVVADNCDDNTADIARSFDVTVLERSNNEHRGKGYALAYGISFLQETPPDVVIIIDADCIFVPGALSDIAYLAYTSKRPTQSRYLMMQPSHPTPKDAISVLAFLVKNWVRLQGLSYWNVPCLLTGTGMAFPWDVIQNAPLASGNIVEDMQLGLDLSVEGHPPIFCPHAVVFGQLPDGTSAAKTQRTRWEHGHIRTILTQVPRLFKEAIFQRRLDLLAIALDLCIPPLSLLIMLWLLLMGVSLGLSFIMTFWVPSVILGVDGLLLILAILVSWFKFGRDHIPARVLLAIPAYILWKIPLYLAFLIRPQTSWIRTQRN